jgi:hypothetical protein
MVILFVHQSPRDCSDMTIVHFQKFYSLSKFILDEPFSIHIGGFSGISSSKLSLNVLD